MLLRNIPACAGKTTVRELDTETEKEHPRVRGENIDACDAIEIDPGTSPRARGKRLVQRFKRFCLRNIPACAGKTPFCSELCVLLQEHPRVRGENISEVIQLLRTTGTSPRARGKQTVLIHYTSVLRNIPACAGKTSMSCSLAASTWEHPRVRGENKSRGCASSMICGTSPRARGKHESRRVVRLPPRNIPACAGKTCSTCTTRLRNSEHPRVRGENGVAARVRSWPRGTSPRARGKLREFHDGFLSCRNIPACAGKTALYWAHRPFWSGTSPRARGKPLPKLYNILRGLEHPRVRGENGLYQAPTLLADRNIPACAGKTVVVSVPRGSMAEHPRVRGENPRSHRPQQPTIGTSPRARGKHRVAPESRRPIRNIPACAGKTTAAHIDAPLKPEHPRVRGENVVELTKNLRNSGTSPRARGKRGWGHDYFVHERNIPACAGKTSDHIKRLGRKSEHPRVRGENARQSAICFSHPGTSPRARGKSKRIPCGFNEIRNIPACAGKTNLHCGPRRLFKEHPRVRGENFGGQNHYRKLGGTSPRARGKRVA